MIEAASAASRDPVLTRRTFIVSGLVLGAAASIPAVRFLLDRPGAAEGFPPLASFVPLIGSSFAVEGGSKLTLVSAEATGPRGSGTYSLLFRARTGAPPLGDRIESLRHPALGRLRLFVAPVGRNIDGQGYQAIVGARVPTKKRGG